MRPFGWLRRNSRITSETAALLLDGNALTGLIDRRYTNSLSDEDETALNTLIYTTRVATTIMALRLEELRKPHSAKAQEILKAFEVRVFSAGLGIRQVKSNMQFIHNFRTFSPTDSNQELAAQTMQWLELWLRQIPSGADIFTSLGSFQSLLLLGRLTEDINAVDSLVKSVLHR